VLEAGGVIQVCREEGTPTPKSPSGIPLHKGTKEVVTLGRTQIVCVSVGGGGRLVMDICTVVFRDIWLRKDSEF
jgi:hypothetical protein